MSRTCSGGPHAAACSTESNAFPLFTRDAMRKRGLCCCCPASVVTRCHARLLSWCPFSVVTVIVIKHKLFSIPYNIENWIHRIVVIDIIYWNIRDEDAAAAAASLRPLGLGAILSVSASSWQSVELEQTDRADMMLIESYLILVYVSLK